ncbi:MAG TPA: DNA-3-methyladenine glycosylase 2 family protein [Patescibacteria group bacterium]|nr:DNA-3-methyladenine glycosylase 2 family protein [Patescibacteria group bacterium]
MWQDAQKFLQKDKYIGPLIKKWGDCKITPIKKSLFFEDLVDAITSQQLSGKAAKTIFGRVKAALHGKITPEAVEKISVVKLRSCGLSFAKCSYVKDLAGKINKGELKIKLLDKLIDEEVIRELIAVKGIGQWTAEMFLMFSLARPDIFPVDDLGIKKGFEKVTGKKFDRTKSAEFAKKNWAPYRTVASWYLWRSLEN